VEGVGRSSGEEGGGGLEDGDKGKVRGNEKMRKEERRER